MEKEDILQQVEKIFYENKIIGIYDFTEDEYSVMVDYVSNLCIQLTSSFDKKHHKLIFATLVEIAKQWKDTDIVEDSEENSSFWGYISKILVGEEEINQKLYNAFTSIISQMGLQQFIPIVRTGKKYYATLMMHSFAPRNSIYSFFDLCYNVFKKDLDFGFTSDDEWLCEIALEQMKNVLGGGYQEDKLVSIGSSAYSIKIGLRSFALNENLSAYFVQFIKDTFYQINKLFNREGIEESTRLKRYIIEWWKNKTESEKFSNETIYKKRIPTVSKQGIVAKYIRNNNEVFLCIPSIRLDNDNNKMLLTVYVNGESVRSEEMRTKRGELVVATKLIDFKLNELMQCFDSISLRVEIKENETVIFDSEKNKTTSLNREFILFDGEKEIFSQINKPTNYFVYSKDIDALKRVPDELTVYGTNLYNIYPNAGESLMGETKQVFFVNKEKSASVGTNACLIGDIADVEWILADISCIVYKNAVKLMIPENSNLKALELRIDNKKYKLQELNYEQIELNCYQFGLKALGIISEDYPTSLSLYSYEKEKTLFAETIIVLPNLDIKFSNPFYYGDIERKVIVSNGDETTELSWSNQDNEVICPLNDGVLIIKVPYLRWRINNCEWRNQPINRKIWYKDFLQNGDLLEIDNPKENETISILGKADGKSFEIVKNQSGRFEIGRAIYANENKQNISVRFSNGKDKFELFTIATKEHFIDNPLSYSNGNVFWNVEDTFIGDRNNEFFLTVKSVDNNLKTKIGNKNCEIKNMYDDICIVQVEIKEKNMFSKEDTYQLIFEGELLVGKCGKNRFKGKKLCIIEVSAAFSDEDSSFWKQPNPTYVIRDLEYFEIIKQGQTYEYYIGNLGIRKTKFNNKINPVRIELRSNNTFGLLSCYNKVNNDNLGKLYFDNINKCLHNSNNLGKYAINLYKFREEDDV